MPSQPAVKEGTPYNGIVSFIYLLYANVAIFAHQTFLNVRQKLILM